jgi:RimJ/RimL family protein N-acetyltransferase
MLETERLRLRYLEPDLDAEFILELLNEPAFIANVADRGLTTVEEARTYIVDKIVSSYAEHGFGFYLIQLRESQIPVGICGLIKRETLTDVDIGYSLLARFEGHGYAHEAAVAVMDYARRALRLKRIVAITAPHNTRSQRLLEKLGLRFEKCIQLPGYATESMFFSSPDFA